MRIVIDWPEWSALPVRVMVTGVRRVYQKAAASPQKRLNKKQIAEAVQMYRDGVPMKEIGAHIKRAPSTTKQIMAVHIPKEERRRFSESGRAGRAAVVARVHEKRLEALNELMTLRKEGPAK